MTANEKQRRDRDRWNKDAPGDPKERIRRLEEHQGTDDERDDPPDREDAVADHHDFGNEQDDGKEDQGNPGIVDRQGLHGKEGHDQRDASDDARENGARDWKTRNKARPGRQGAGCRRYWGR